MKIFKDTPKRQQDLFDVYWAEVNRGQCPNHRYGCGYHNAAHRRPEVKRETQTTK